MLPQVPVKLEDPDELREPRAAIVGMALAMDGDLEGLGYAIIPCGGKNNIRNPLTIFRKLGIPVFAVWDGDKGEPKANPADNLRLLRSLGKPEEDWPTTQVAEHFACFETNLDGVVGAEIGNELFNQSLSECQTEFGIARVDQVLTSSVTRQAVFTKAKQKGKTSATLEAIVTRLRALRS